MDKKLSRRDFLKGGSLVAAGIAGGAALSGCSTDAIDETGGSSTTADWLPTAWDYECDFLVIGYGGAGLWAALTAVDECDATVLCLEKAPVRGGGNTSINMGEFCFTEDIEGCVTYIKNFSKGIVPEEIARAYATEVSRNLEYALKWGTNSVELEGSQASGFTSTSEYPDLDTAKAMKIARLSEGGNGPDGWIILDKARADLGIEVIFDCHDEELIQNPETKEIVGAYSLIGSDGKKYAIKARKGTLLSTGGFEFNEEMHAQYLKVYPARGFYGWPFNEGDGHKMAMKVGAQLRNMTEMIGYMAANFPNNPYKYSPMLSPQTPNYLYVNRLGDRFMTETFFNPHNGWHKVTKFNDDICDFEAIPTWVIFDQTAIDAGPLGPQAQSDKMNMWLDGLPEECGAWGGWSLDNKAEIEKGWVKTGATLEELIADMANPSAFADDKMDVEKLRASIERYNGFCAAGEDTDFGRVPATLLPVNNPPYYAFASYPGLCTTLGGPKKNEYAQVLDGADNVIPRLYCAGSISNFQAHTYGLSGGGNGENMVWGRIAARHACALESWDAQDA
jgi:hypothetical protein